MRTLKVFFSHFFTNFSVILVQICNDEKLLFFGKKLDDNQTNEKSLKQCRIRRKKKFKKKSMRNWKKKVNFPTRPDQRIRSKCQTFSEKIGVQD